MGGSQDDGAPNLTPLLDLVLQLIMFFMITVNFIRVDQFNDDIQLPTAQAAVPLDRAAEDWVFLNLNKDGKLVGSAEAIDTEARLKAYLTRERLRLEEEAQAKGRKGPVNVVVVLRAHKDCRYADVWQVLQNCTKAGYRRWQLRVEYKSMAKAS